MSENTSTIQKYIKKFVKRNIIVCLGCSVSVSIILFIVALIYGTLSENIFLCFFPIVMGMAFFLIITLPCVCEFCWLIRYQEKMFNTKFDDKNATQLNSSLVYLSEDWLICSGRCAFYRKYIKSFSFKRYRRSRGVNYKVTVNSVNGRKHSFYTEGSKDIDKYRLWFHRR